MRCFPYSGGSPSLGLCPAPTACPSAAFALVFINRVLPLGCAPLTAKSRGVCTHLRRCLHRWAGRHRSPPPPLPGHRSDTQTHTSAWTHTVRVTQAVESPTLSHTFRMNIRTNMCIQPVTKWACYSTALSKLPDPSETSNTNSIINHPGRSSALLPALVISVMPRGMWDARSLYRRRHASARAHAAAFGRLNYKHSDKQTCISTALPLTLYNCRNRSTFHDRP